MNRDKLLCCNKVLIGFSVYIDLFASKAVQYTMMNEMLYIYSMQKNTKKKEKKMFLISVCGVLLWFSIQHLFTMWFNAKEKL